VVADRYDEDWTRLGWVMLQGKAELLLSGLADDQRAMVEDVMRRHARLTAPEAL
jgi:hypothetical protein